jgi:hypothetical protein
MSLDVCFLPIISRKFYAIKYFILISDRITGKDYCKSYFSNSTTSILRFSFNKNQNVFALYYQELTFLGKPLNIVRIFSLTKGTVLSKI